MYVLGVRARRDEQWPANPPVQTHQNNHLRILALRAQVAALDAQIKSTLVALAASRRDMMQTPATEFPEDSTNRFIRRDTKHYPFTYDELMSYARRISRNTVPASGQTDGFEFYAQFSLGAGGPGAAADAAAAAAAASSGPATAAATPAAMTATPGAVGGGVNGAATPSAAQSALASQRDTPGGPVATAAGGPSAGGEAGAAAGTSGAGPASGPPANVPDVLPTEMQQFITPAAGTVFLPWPTPELMQNGALRAMQTVMDGAKTTTGFAAADRANAMTMPPVSVHFVTLEAQEEAERERAAREAKEREAWEERQRQIAEAAAAAAAAEGPRPAGPPGGYGGHAAPAAPAQFSSTLDMDDDD